MVTTYKVKGSSPFDRSFSKSGRFAVATLFLSSFLYITSCGEASENPLGEGVHLPDSGTLYMSDPVIADEDTNIPTPTPSPNTMGNTGYSGSTTTSGVGGTIEPTPIVTPPSNESTDASVDASVDASADASSDAQSNATGDASDDIPDELIDLINDSSENPPDNTIEVAQRGPLDSFTDGTCCDDGNCLCHGDVPSRLTATNGPFRTATTPLFWGTVYYPTDADPPFASVMVTGGFMNTGAEMVGWGSFYASWGIATVIVNTTPIDIPHMRAGNMMNAIVEMEAANENSASPLYGKLTNWYGVSGYSMGGGGTWICAMQDDQLKTSVSLAGHHLTAGGALLVAPGTVVPSLMLCGSADTAILGGGGQSQQVYDTIPPDTPKMLFEIAGASHMVWFSPTQAGFGASGQYALAFQKVFLEGDERWKDLLIQRPSNASDWRTNIQ